MENSTDEEGGTARMAICRIECTDFKSFPNTVTVGPFDPRFTALVGRPESGKSNVIDSICFVFDYRGQHIRSKKLSEFIHNSSKYPNVEKCKVAVHFEQIIDKEDGTYEFVPNSEIVVARTAFKNNSSLYTINGEEKAFQEVAKLLGTFGIDLWHNRFFVLQGEVEAISMMKAKAQAPNETGLLEYLENVIGTGEYKRSLSQINERLLKLNEEQSEKQNRCRLAKRELKNSEIPQQVVEYLKSENKMYQEKNIYCQLHILNEKKIIQKLEEEKQITGDVLKVHDAKFEEINKQREEKEKMLRDEVKKIEELMTKFHKFENILGQYCKEYVTESEELIKRVEDMKNNIQVLTKDSSLSDEIAKLQKEEADGKVKRIEIDHKLNAIEDSINQRSKMVQKWESEIAALLLHEIPNEVMPDPPFQVFTEEELKSHKFNDTKYAITSLNEKHMVIKPKLNREILDHNKKREAYLKERADISDNFTVKRNEMQQEVDRVQKRLLETFTSGLEIINKRLKEIFKMLTIGDDAKLELLDNSDPFSEGIVFSVLLPKKSWENVSKLSAREQTLSSIALVLAVKYYKPSPLYFMDEIEPILNYDDAKIIAKLVYELQKTLKAQVVIISSNFPVIEAADRVVSIFKHSYFSKSKSCINECKQYFIKELLK